MKDDVHTNGGRILIAWVALGVAFLALDAVWLTTMADRLYRPALSALMRPDFDPWAAAAFYALYFVGVVAFVVLPATGAASAARRGALFGLVAYGTYDLTNQATLRGWPWHVTAADLAWGALATALAAVVSRAALALADSRRRTP